jgi:hypothetical protein
LIQTKDLLPTVATGEVRSVPSWHAHAGARRLLAAAQLVGEEEAKRIARKEGTYELEDSLADALRLEGLTISAKGEFPALSPANWLCSAGRGSVPLAAWRDRWNNEGVQLKAILLSELNRKAFLKFLHTVSCDSVSDAWELLGLADHFFQCESHDLIVTRITN